MPAQPCRFGRACHRPDCWFAHPEARAVDDKAAGAGAGAGGGGVSGGGSGASAAPSAAPGAPPGAAPCRFGTACTRAGCYFAHPEGRVVDGTAGGAAPPGAPPPPPQQQEHATPPRDVDFLPDDLDSPTADQAAMEEMMFEMEQSVQADTWFPEYRNCGCCKGFIYGCEADICVSLGVCGCVHDADDG